LGVLTIFWSPLHPTYTILKPATLAHTPTPIPLFFKVVSTYFLDRLQGSYK
jgi:hypothetical protein